MDFKQGTMVVTSDGKDVGRIDRVVLDPQTRRVSHIIVRQGSLFTEDKVVPVQMIDSPSGDRVALHRDSEHLPELELFEERFYVPYDEDPPGAVDYDASSVRPILWYPPVGTFMTTYPVAPSAPYYLPDQGTVERVIADEQTHRATHLVVSQGLLFKTRKTMPVTWIDEVGEEELRLNVGDHVLEQLPGYQEH
jgi:uncharacterized protein YrrD